MTSRRPIVPPAGLSDAAARRLANQLARAFRGTYGARTGLRTIVKGLVREMRNSGMPPADVAALLEECVLSHPARPAGDPPSIITGATLSQGLVELMHECVAEGNTEVRARG